MEPQYRREPTPDQLALAGLMAAMAITASDTDHDDALAFEFLRVAWPTLRAQNQ
jgi:hypothetical protein